MERKIVQIACSEASPRNSVALFALASDGTLWRKMTHPADTPQTFPWIQIQPLPESDDSDEPLPFTAG